MRKIHDRILKVALIGLLFLSVTGTRAFALDLYTTEILEKAAIAQLSNEKLIDTYIEVVIDLEASKTFNETAGFTAREYGLFKKLLRYKIYLAWEIEKRELEVPDLGL
ncbi:MAG: hypothetical protein KAR05_12220 [Candidatus Omnitrophica bacterium]|nr:hypothetical protein [Candidatus Omnitrophota bacterium]